MIRRLTQQQQARQAALKAWDAIRKETLGPVNVPTYWSQTLGRFVTIPDA